MSAVVYRIYDASGRLIYIGASSNLEQRLDYHRANAWWWALAAGVTEESHADMNSAFDAEWAAIAGEEPAFNVARRRGQASRRPMPLADDDAQVLRDWIGAKPHRGSALPMALWWARARALATP